MCFPPFFSFFLLLSEVAFTKVIQTGFIVSYQKLRVGSIKLSCSSLTTVGPWSVRSNASVTMIIKMKLFSLPKRVPFFSTESWVYWLQDFSCGLCFNWNPCVQFPTVPSDQWRGPSCFDLSNSGAMGRRRETAAEGISTGNGEETQKKIEEARPCPRGFWSFLFFGFSRS